MTTTDSIHSSRLTPALAPLLVLVAGLGLSACGEASPTSTTAPSGAAAVATAMQGDLPSPRAGLWKTTSSMADGSHEEATDCITEAASPLDSLGAADLSRCSRHQIRKAGAGYMIDVSCASEGMTMSLKGSVQGDFKTAMSMDLDLGIGVADGDVQTTHMRTESRYVGPCPAA